MIFLALLSSWSPCPASKVRRLFFVEPRSSSTDGSKVDVFEAVRDSLAEFGVVPIENSSMGPVVETIELLRTTTLPTRHMVPLKIGHALLGRRGVAAERITTIYSHEQVRRALEWFEPAQEC